jgi:putative Mg2+ transporter-C (MgtC) family protein
MESVLIIVFRLLFTFVLALLFGIERQKSHKPLGFGAFIFVSMGACGLGLIAVDLVPENPLPLLGAVVSGIGFLGAGALIKSDDKLFGVTTAAGIWGFAIIGILVGTGEYLVGILIYTAAWAVVVIDRYLEKKGIGSYQRKITITTNKIIHEKELKNDLLIITEKFKLMEVDVDKKENKMVLTYFVEGTKDNINKLPKLLYDKDWFSSCKIE